MIPIVTKREGDKLRIPSREENCCPVRFTSYKTDNCLPLHGLISKMWVDEESVDAFPQVMVRFVFYTKNGGQLGWDWIRLRDFASVCSRLHLDTKELHQWHLEFIATAEAKDFAPVLFMVLHV